MYALHRKAREVLDVLFQTIIAIIDRNVQTPVLGARDDFEIILSAEQVYSNAGVTSFLDFILIRGLDSP
jgi:hypothetical protein